MARYWLRLIGPMELTDPAGCSVRVPPGKLQGLLGYLAYRPGRRVARGELAELLWGERPPGRARHSLSQALTRLRKAAGPIVIDDGGSGTLALDAERVSVDIDVLRADARADDYAALAEAAELIRGEFLEGLQLDEPDFDAWLLSAQGEVRDLMLGVHERLLEAAQQAGDRDDVVHWARRLLEMDPAFEPAHRALVETHAERGAVATARAQFHQCRRWLETELGIAPSRETEDLASRLWAGEATAGRRGRPDVLVLPVAADDTVDRAVLDDVVDDTVAELERQRSVGALAGRTSIGRDEAGSAAELGAARGLDYSLAIDIEKRSGKPCVRATLVRTEDADVLTNWTHVLDAAEIFDPGVVAAPVRHHVEQDWLARAKRVSEEDWGGYTHFLRGMELYFDQWNATESWARALPHFEKAVQLEAELTQVRARRDSIRCHEDIWPGRGDPTERTAAFMDASHRALEVDPGEPNVHRMLSLMHLHHWQRYDAAYHQFSRGLRANPNDANLNVAFGRYLAHVGKPDRALAVIRRAQRLNPVHPDYYWEQLALPLYVLGRHEEALAALQRVRRPSYYEHLYMAASEAALERYAAAGRSLEQALAEKPNLHASGLTRLMPYADETVARRLRQNLRTAGLPR